MGGNFSLTAGDLSRLLTVVGGPAVEGACNAMLTVGGSLARPQFSINLTASHLAVERYTVGDLTIDADMHPDGRLNLTALSVQNQGSRITASSPILGVLNGRMQLVGPLQSAKADLVLHGSGLRTDTAAIGDIDVRMRWEADTLFLDRLDLKTVSREDANSFSGAANSAPPGSTRSGAASSPRAAISSRARGTQS